MSEDRPSAESLGRVKRHCYYCRGAKIAVCICEPLAREIDAAVLAERERCATAIRAACENCDGTGAERTSRAEHSPYCDGNCQSCPVEVEDFEQCEYCGRPIDAILRAPAPVAPTPEPRQKLPPCPTCPHGVCACDSCPSCLSSVAPTPSEPEASCCEDGCLCEHGWRHCPIHQDDGDPSKGRDG